MPAGSGSFINVAFFDAYFSNFIEGTEFEVEEALQIIGSGIVPADRPADGRDILGQDFVNGWISPSPPPRCGYFSDSPSGRGSLKRQHFPIN